MFANNEFSDEEYKWQRKDNNSLSNRLLPETYCTSILVSRKRSILKFFNNIFKYICQIFWKITFIPLRAREVSANLAILINEMESDDDFPSTSTKTQKRVSYKKNKQALQKQMPQACYTQNFESRSSISNVRKNLVYLEKIAGENSSSTFNVSPFIPADNTIIEHLDLTDDNVIIEYVDLTVEFSGTIIIDWSPSQQKLIQDALSTNPSDVIITKFNISITGWDIQTLFSLNWLNDQIINFYLLLLSERSERCLGSGDLPKLYSMNTFFYQRLTEGGHLAVRQWTRNVNLFDYDIILVPIHVKQIHWCMAAINLENKTIKYYDAFNTPNSRVLRVLKRYLEDESVDKLNSKFSITNFKCKCVTVCGRQLNHSDCGVFSCMFAEYISREKDINFTQKHMSFFRQKMIIEIVQGELLNP